MLFCFIYPKMVIYSKKTLRKFHNKIMIRFNILLMIVRIKNEKKLI